MCRAVPFLPAGSHASSRALQSDLQKPATASWRSRRFEHWTGSSPSPYSSPVSSGPPEHRRQWRFYQTEKGNCPVRKFLDDLTDDDAAEVVVEMKAVQTEGLTAARHLDGEIYEVRASGKDVIYRILFAKEGRFGQVLLALDGFNKKTQKTPPAKIELAKRRLSDWRSRGKSKKPA